MMRRVIIGLVGLLLVAGPATAQERRLTSEERRELEQKLRDLREQMRDLERQLGRVSGVLVAPRMLEGPMTFALASHRPRLGVVVKTDRDAATDSIGAVLEAVTPDGPAAKAGLQAGDIVVTFEGTRLASGSGSPGDRLIDLAGDMEEGDTVRLAYRRGRDTRTATVAPKVLEDASYAYSFRLDDSTMGAARRAWERALEVTPRAAPRVDLRGRLDPLMWSVQVGSRWSDMELTTVDADLGSYFGTTEGLLVVRPPKDGLLGLKSGDVIVRIGGRVPTSPSHAMRIFRSYDAGDEIRVDIMRNKAARELKAIVPNPERGLFWEEHP